MTRMITFSKADLERFKVAYKAAVETGQDQFTFDGNAFVVGYAKYLIEYLEGQFK